MVEAKGECGVAEEAVVEAGMDRLGEISIRAIKETVATGEEAISGLKVEIGEIMVAMVATTEEVGTMILKEGGEIRAMAEAMVGTDQATMAIWATATEDGVVPVEAMAEVMAAMEEDRLWMPEDMTKASAVDLCAKIQVVTVEAEWEWVVTALLLMVPGPTVGEEEVVSEAVEVTVVAVEAVATVMAIVRKHD